MHGVQSTKMMGLAFWKFHKRSTFLPPNQVLALTNFAFRVLRLGRVFTMGLSDLILGSDLLYEPNHPDLLSTFIDLHSCPQVQVIIIDPGRRQQSQFTQKMENFGFTSRFERATAEQSQSRDFKGKILQYSRDHR